MDEEARKRKVEYNTERNKQLRKDKIIKDFKTTLPYEEVEKINKLLEKKDMNKVEFVRYAYEKLKNDTTDKDILLKGKNVIRKYNNLMTLNDRNTIDEFNKELDKIIKEV